MPVSLLLPGTVVPAPAEPVAALRGYMDLRNPGHNPLQPRDGVRLPKGIESRTQKTDIRVLDVFAQLHCSGREARLAPDLLIHRIA